MATTKLSDSGTLGNKYENLSADNNYMETIASSSGAAAGRTFIDIPQTYKHLQIRMIVRDLSASNPSACFIRFNGDTSSNYAYHNLQGNGATASSSGTASQGYIIGPLIPGSTQLTNNYGCVIVDILDYTNTNKNTTIRTIGGYDNNGSGAVSLTSGLWLNTAAITSIQVGAFYQSDDTYTRISLYGIKG
jgi:hypothetical protein